MFIYKMHRPSLPECTAWGSGRAQGLVHLRPQEHHEGWGLGKARRAQAPPDPHPRIQQWAGDGGTVLPSPRSRPRVQSVHVFLQGLQTGVYFSHVGLLVVGAVLFDGDPAPRISQASLMAAMFHRSELLQRVRPTPACGAGRLPAVAVNASREGFREILELAAGAG